MRHRKKTIKLGRTSSHREALMASLVCSLIEQSRITTTLPKARAARSIAEKMVTLGKRGTLAARRQAMAKLHRKEHVAKLFDEVAPQFKDRAGGYTRIVKLGRRGGDNSEQAILEWIQAEVATKTKKKTAVKKDKPVEKEDSPKTDTADAKKESDKKSSAPKKKSAKKETKKKES